MNLGPGGDPDANRDRILRAALDIVGAGGPAALSTRAVCAAAHVQAPTIYRIFGDKQGLMDAVAAHGFATYAQQKLVGKPCADPVDGLRRGWDLHIQFALDHPALYVMTYGQPRPGPLPPAAANAADMLAGRIRRVAQEGRLRLTEKHAAQLMRAGASGVALALIGTPEIKRDLTLSHLAREAIMNAIATQPSTGGGVEPDLISSALHVRSALSRATRLSSRERDLLEEWIDRITDPAQPQTSNL